jgi:hypothetical protein
MNTDNQRPWVWISETAEKYKAAVEDYSGLRRNFEELSQKYENVVDRCDTKFRKADDSVDLWYNFYFDEAVANTERLHNQIQALKAERGETHFIESAQPRNPRVADRNVSRCATLWISGGYAIPATYEVLRELRPHGFMPHIVTGKVGLKRKFLPLSEEEAARRIEISRDSRATRSSSRIFCYGYGQRRRT